MADLVSLLACEIIHVFITGMPCQIVGYIVQWVASGMIYFKRNMWLIYATDVLIM